ncbi:hypothetical protein [Virgisporangium aurantiacum]|uniref:hypothetical protein n=1 Tax=Virgisporangium aurantiacum TaxID=175570 RepID=UPI00194FF9B4|nr:hypothetical protein [Virgisporangium aurantiacum]
MSDKPRWRAVLGWTALAVFGFGCMAAVFEGFLDDGPLDYRTFGLVAGLTAVLGSVIVAPLVAIRLARSRTAAPPPRRVVAIVAAGLIAVVLVGAWKGVIVPWAPVASGTEAACPALDRAGLSQAWPDAPRERTRDDVDHNDLGVFSYCSWTVDAETPSQKFVLLNSFVWLYEGTREGTALGWAIREYRDRNDDAVRRRTLGNVGDEGFADDGGDRLTVVARRANVLIQVEIYPSSSDAGRIAQDLVRRMAAGVSTR